MTHIARIAALFFLASGMGYAADWESLQACGQTHRDTGSYCLEILHLPGTSSSFLKRPLLLIPGFSQSAKVFDLLPEQGISFARALAERFDFDVFILNPRGIGASDYPAHSDLDDLGAEDVPTALEFVARRTHRRVIVVGHSQGGITALSALSGLTHQEDQGYFNARLARFRQKWVKGLVVVGSNPDMRPSASPSFLSLIGMLGSAASSVAGGFLDYIPLSKLPMGASHVWDFLYHRPNVSPEAREAVIKTTVDATSAGVVRQFSQGIHVDGIQSSAGQKYSDYLALVQVPVAQVALGRDALADVESTYRDSFERIGSRKKRFFEIEGQGHEDFMLNAELHSTLDDAIRFVAR